MSGLDQDPGFYEPGGSLNARTEQQRATVREELRTARHVCVSMMTEDGHPLHWIIVLDNAPEEGEPFLAWAAAKAIRDMSATTGKSLQACAYAALQVALKPDVP